MSGNSDDTVVSKQEVESQEDEVQETPTETVTRTQRTGLEGTNEEETITETDTTTQRTGLEGTNEEESPTETDTTTPRTGREGTDEESLQLQVAEPKTPSTSIALSAEFSSFVSLRNALHKYQQEKRVQLVVKDSKLLCAESTKKIMPKVHHRVNKELMYHSITYCCKCHGELKHKPESRIKKVGTKRLSCPMYIRFKLTPNLQSLVLFDLLESHNHPIDMNTLLMSPRQQIYRMAAIDKGLPDPGDVKKESTRLEKPAKIDVQSLIASAIEDVNSISSLGETDYEPTAKAARKSGCTKNDKSSVADRPKVFILPDISSDSDTTEYFNEAEEEDQDDGVPYKHNPYTPLDPEASSCSDSEDEEFRNNLSCLPFPIRLIGSAVRSHPELIALSKELIESQKALLIEQTKCVVLKNKVLELKSAKLALEIQNLEQKHGPSASNNTTTVFLHS